MNDEIGILDVDVVAGARGHDVRATTRECDEITL